MVRIASRIAAVLLLAVAAGGCTETLRKAGQVAAAVTQNFANPVGARDLHAAELAYAAALQLSDSYRVTCWSKPFAAIKEDVALRPLCQRRRHVVRQMQKARAKARASLDVAINFVQQNPTLNAAKVVGAAWAAVTAFQQAHPAVASR
jgi:hypothetical protein